jgi:hypothetical protein
VLPWVALGVALVGVALLGGGGRRDGGAPLDPAGTGPEGARALVLLLEAFGAQVTVTDDLDLADADVALMLSDVVPAERVGDVEAWVRDGGTLVVADPFSGFTPPTAPGTGLFGGLPSAIPRDDCDLDALAGLDRLATGGAGTRYEVPSGSGSCFGDGREAFVVATPVGSGTVVALGSPAPLLNEHLDEADDAGLATALLAPRPGTRVAFLQPGAGVPGGDRGLFSVLSRGARLALWQLLVAFVVYAAFRARRLGRPVPEPQPVQIAASELVSAVGHLLARTRDPERAAVLLRDDLRRRLAERLGLPPDAPPGVVADATAARTSVPREAVLGALAGPPVTTDAGLVELAGTIDAVRTEVLHAV